MDERPLFTREMTDRLEQLARARDGETWCEGGAEPSVGGAAMPPTRPKLCVSRAPVSSSMMSQTISRALRYQRKGVKAPSSIAMAPSQVR